MSPNLLQMTSNVLIRTPGFHLWASGGAFHGALSLLTQLPSKPLTIVHRSLSSSLPNGSIVHHYRIPDSCSVCGSGYKRVTGNAVRNYSASPSQKPKPSSVGGALQESSESGRGAVTLTTAEKGITQNMNSSKIWITWKSEYIVTLFAFNVDFSQRKRKDRILWRGHHCWRFNWGCHALLCSQWTFFFGKPKQHLFSCI